MSTLPITVEEAKALLVAISWAEDAAEDFDYRVKNRDDGYTDEDVKDAHEQWESWVEIGARLRAFTEEGS